MGNRSRRKNQRLERTADGKRIRTDRANRSGSSGHYLVWATGVLLIIAAAAVAWTVFKQDDPKSAAIPPAESQASAPAAVDTPPARPDSVTQNTVSGTPKITFPKPEHDFGTIAQGSKPSHTFVVKNTGDAPLRLISAKGT